MYCYHCGKHINEYKIEHESSSLSGKNGEILEVDENVEIQYICPRCGHLIHAGYSEEDVKELSRASHAQIQRAANKYSRGMCMAALGAILLIIGIIFFILANKPAQGFILQVNCAEFYVSVASLILAIILLGFGVTFSIIGVRDRHTYSQLLKDINNKTFVQ